MSKKSTEYKPYANNLDTLLYTDKGRAGLLFFMVCLIATGYLAKNFGQEIYCEDINHRVESGCSTKTNFDNLQLPLLIELFKGADPFMESQIMVVLSTIGSWEKDPGIEVRTYNDPNTHAGLTQMEPDRKLIFVVPQGKTAEDLNTKWHEIFHGVLDRLGKRYNGVEDAINEELRAEFWGSYFEQLAVTNGLVPSAYVQERQNRGMVMPIVTDTLVKYKLNADSDLFRCLHTLGTRYFWYQAPNSFWGLTAFAASDMAKIGMAHAQKNCRDVNIIGPPGSKNRVIIDELVSSGAVAPEVFSNYPINRPPKNLSLISSKSGFGFKTSNGLRIFN